MQGGGDAESGEKGTGGPRENHAEEEKTPTRKKSRKKLKTSTISSEKPKTSRKSPASNRAKPSFPAKKRVQVPQDILLETPLRNLKTGGSITQVNKEGTQEASIKRTVRAIGSEKTDQVKEPFFWLREEQDGERLSAQTDEDQITEGPTPIPPSFSDLKDADDESPSKQATSVSRWLLIN